METSALEYSLTVRERKTFEEEGYLCIEDALSTDQVAALSAAMDRVQERESHSSGSNGRSKAIDFYKAIMVEDFIKEDRAFLELVDWERTLPKVWGIVGWNIYIYYTQMIITPPSGKAKSEATFGWHQDSDRVNRDIETHPRPRLSVKVGFFVSDASVEGRGNFWVVPGSQYTDDLERPPGVWSHGWHADGDGQPAGAEPVLVKPGTAVIFDRRLWHAGTPNWSDVTRKVLFYGYGPRWMKRKGPVTVDQFWPESDDIRRQLLGYTTEENGTFSPTADDVPLFGWLREHDSSDAIGRLTR